MKRKTLFLTQAAVIAALYVALAGVSQLFGLASGQIQCRISEALCVLPVFTAAAVPGVTIGCLVFNLFSANIYDIIFGTLATLIGALLARLLRRYRYLSPIPTILSNALIIPLVIISTTAGESFRALPFLMLTVGIGEIISCGVLGTVLLIALYPQRHRIFGELL